MFVVQFGEIASGNSLVHRIPLIELDCALDIAQPTSAIRILGIDLFAQDGRAGPRPG